MMLSTPAFSRHTTSAVLRGTSTQSDSAPVTGSDATMHTRLPSSP